jgi:hypothetical protein
MNRLEREVQELRKKVALLYSIVIEGKQYTPGIEEWDRVVEAIDRGDRQALINFKRRGGIVPIEDDQVKPVCTSGHAPGSG